MASKGPKVSKQGIPGKKKCVTLTVPLKLKIIRRLGSGSSNMCHIKKHKDQLRLFVACVFVVCESLKDLYKQQTSKHPKLAQLYKVLYKGFTAMHSERKPMTGPKKLEKARLFMMK
jgi:hypothetical protein